MRTQTIRLHEDTIVHIERAAKKAGVPKATFIRYRLERLFDGSAHNPLGFWATPEFYTMLCDALGTIWILHHELDSKSKKLSKMKSRDIRKELQIDHEFLG